MNDNKLKEIETTALLDKERLKIGVSINSSPNDILDLVKEVRSLKDLLEESWYSMDDVCNEDCGRANCSLAKKIKYFLEL